MRGLLGIAAILFLAILLSEGRRKIRLRKVVGALGLQLAIAVVLLKLPFVRDWVSAANRAVGLIESSTTQASSFLFGYLGGGPLPFQEIVPGASFIVAFRVLPLVLVMSALSSILFYWGVLPLIVRGFSFLLRKSLGMSGAAGLAAAADVFLGIAEAPLFVKPYLPSMSRDEIFMVMTCGMASVAGTVMVLYASTLSAVLPDAIGHILVASVITIPAGVLIAHCLIPGEDGDRPEPVIPKTAESTLDALVRGTMDGVQMLLAIVAMILVLFALVNLLNGILGLLPSVGGAALTVQGILGWIFRPLLYLMGIAPSELGLASELMGTKVAMNEFVAYLSMAKNGGALSPQSRIILTYAMCGFANFASVGICVGGMATLVPERKAEIVSLGFKSLVAGNLATCLTGAVVGLLF